MWKNVVFYNTTGGFLLSHEFRFHYRSNVSDSLFPILPAHMFNNVMITEKKLGESGGEKEQTVAQKYK